MTSPGARASGYRIADSDEKDGKVDLQKNGADGETRTPTPLGAWT